MGKFEKKVDNLNANRKDKPIFCVFFNKRSQLFCDLQNKLFGHLEMLDLFFIIILHHKKIWMPNNVFSFHQAFNLLCHQDIKLQYNMKWCKTMAFILAWNTTYYQMLRTLPYNLRFRSQLLSKKSKTFTITWWLGKFGFTSKSLLDSSWPRCKLWKEKKGKAQQDKIDK
jgi:hypothetical protein